MSKEETIQKRQKHEQELLIEQLKTMPIVQIACERVGVGGATYYRWKKENEEFSKRADDALQESVLLMNDVAESQLLSSIKEKNMTGIIFWLKHRHKAYSTKVELSGSIKTHDGKLSVEQQALLDKAINLVFGDDHVAD